MQPSDLAIVTSSDGCSSALARYGDDLAALEAEHRDNGEEQSDERDRADRRQETCLIPFAPFRFCEEAACQIAREEGDAEVDENHFGERQEADAADADFEAEERWQKG